MRFLTSERNILLKALAQSKDSSTLGKYLNMTLGQEKVAIFSMVIAWSGEGQEPGCSNHHGSSRC